jgi:hypothetical protein
MGNTSKMLIVDVDVTVHIYKQGVPSSGWWRLIILQVVTTVPKKYLASIFRVEVLLLTWALKMDPHEFLLNVVKSYKIVHHHNREDHTYNLHLRENLISHASPTT